MSQHTSILTERQLFDLEMILNGGFAPLTGFINERDYHSILDRTRLANGTVWPIPITLDVNEAPQISDEIILLDQYKTQVGRLIVESVYAPDIEKEALQVCGTLDQKHPGVAHLFNHTKKWYVGGTVSPLQPIEHFDFLEIRKTPAELKAYLAERVTSGTPIVAFQTRNPIHRAHFELARRSAAKIKGHTLIHPVVGPTKEGDIDYVTRVRGYKKLIEQRGGADITLALLPLAMRMAGPREALWHALIRKNYGATHFIVGRDHAGPGNDSNGKPFYGPYDAQKLVAEFADEIGITPVFSEELVYVKSADTYKELKDVLPSETTDSISGTQFRDLIKRGEPIPEWFSFPEVIDEIRRAQQKRGVAVLFTGLSGAGKSTLARHVKARLEHEFNRTVSFFDGDIVRAHLTEGLGFSREDRIKNVTRVGYVAAEIARHGSIALASLIAPYEEARQKFKEQVEKAGGTYIEIYVHAPLEVLASRDVKGYYKKHKAGELKGLTGVDDVYEVPTNPDLVIETSNSENIESAILQVLGVL